MSQSQSRNKGASFLAILLLASSASAIAAGLLLAIQLIVDPDGIVWLHKILPQQTKTVVTDRQTMRTLPEIRSLVERMGMIPGDTLDLNTAERDLLLPVRSVRPNCQTDCEYISQLRVYRRVDTPKYFSTAGAYYQLVSQMSVSYSDEDVDTPLDDRSVDLPSSGQLQLTSVELTSPQPEMQGLGPWIHLTGRQRTGDGAIAYGKVLYYNPRETHLVQMLQWASPAGEPAVWRKVTGDRTLELIVNQTVGFEPKFKIYQIQPRQERLAPVALVEIALTPFDFSVETGSTHPVVSHPAHNIGGCSGNESPRADLALKNYQNALILARSGLWTPALEMLQPLTRSPDWSPGAQAQLELIRMHSQVSQSQANKSWASPSQQVLTQIIDGRWQSALQIFQKTHNQREIARLLKTDSDSLWNRIKAALRVTSTQSDAIAWGALIRTAKDGLYGGSAWLEKQPTRGSINHQQIEKLLQQLDNALWKSSVPHVSRIVASVEPKDELSKKDWLHNPPTTAQDTLKLDSSQVWYQLRVAGFHNGQRWLRYPFPDRLADSSSGARLWHLLGLDFDPHINLTFWTSGATPKTIEATVKAVRLEKGVLRLLAAGQALPDDTLLTAPTPLAFTAKALEWLDPQVITLADLSRSRPQLARALLHQLWPELQAAGSLTIAMAPPTLSQLLPYEASANVFPLVLGNSLVQLVDLTGDRQPEIVLTLSAQVFASLNGNTQTGPRTVIFDRTATAILYSEFQPSQSKTLIAIA
ncbi:MAG: hypothetical protein EBE86_019545 [Hormoscilla sp. GUM202]|nr:hypothetical protein [Hormoscilla sp. GUM202]